MMNKSAIISGFSGQDGSYLAQLLLSKGYKVYGMVRRLSNPNLDFIKEMKLEQVELVEADLGDTHSLYHIISRIKPDEFYNLGSMSHVGTSFIQPEHTGNITGLGPLRILENIRLHSSQTRFYQASTSELFGNAPAPQNELTPFLPRSPYGVAKLAAHMYVKVYRESYNLYACCGILNNHESPRRSKDFLSRKVTDYIGRYINAFDCDIGTLKIGNLESRRDFGYAKEYVWAMWKMLQQNSPSDYVIGTDESHSVREFCEEAFRCIDIELEWIGEGLTEKGINKNTGKILVEIDPKYYRPAEVNLLQSDCSKARRELGWEPKVSFPELVKIMVDYDIVKNKNLRKEMSRVKSKN